MARISRGRFRWLREEYRYREWRKDLLGDLKRNLHDIRVGDFVQPMATRGYYEGCKKLDHEMDMEIFIDIKTLENPTFMTIHRNKPRTVEHERVYEVMSIEAMEATF